MKHRLLKLTAIGAAGLLVVGCSGGGGGSSEEVPPITDPVAGEAPEGILEGITLTYAADGGTTQDAQMNAFFTPFAEVTGAQVNQDSPQTLAKIQSQVETGSYQWDFVSSYADTIAQECDVLFEKIDESKLDLSNVPESLLGATECGVPSIPYAMMIVYNGDTFGDDGPQSWADFYDTEKFPGTRALNSGDGKIDGSIVQGAAIAAGWDPDSEEFSVEWANKGLDMIESAKESIVFYGTGAQAQQMLESGEADMGGVWNGRALAAEKNGANLQAVWTDWISIIDYFAILKGAPNAEAAYYAINYAYGQAQQEQWTEESGYSPVHVDAQPDIDDLTAQYITTTPEREATSVDIALDLWSDKDVVTALQDRWASIVAGA